MGLYNDHDRIALTNTVDELHTRVITDWWHHHTTGTDTILLAGTRRDTNILNQLARHQLAAHGQLTGPTLTLDDRTYQAGDRIVILRNGHATTPNGQRVEIDNGTTATITTIDPTTPTITAHLPTGDTTAPAKCRRANTAPSSTTTQPSTTPTPTESSPASNWYAPPASYNTPEQRERWTTTAGDDSSLSASTGSTNET